MLVSASLFFNKPYRWNHLLTLMIAYYLFAFFLFPLHLNWLNFTSYHHAVKGLLYVSLGFSILSNNQLNIRNVLLHFSLILGISQLVQVVSAISFHHLLNFGAMGSYTGLVCLLAAYVLFKEKECGAFSRIVGICLLIFFAFLANSINSVISFLAAILAHDITSRRYLRVIVMLSTAFAIGLWIYSQLEEGAFLIANKSLESILSGSGRLMIYQHCINYFVSDSMPFWGFGLLNESEIFRTSHPLDNGPLTCHSSVLSTISSYGAIGITFLLILYAVLISRLFKRKADYSEYSNIALISVFLFSLFSAFLPGAGSLIVTLAILAWGRRGGHAH